MVIILDKKKWNINLNLPLDLFLAAKLPNMHIHTKWCNHSSNEIIDLVDYLQKNNLIGYLNEHAPYVDKFFEKNSELLRTDLFYSYDQIVSDYTIRSMNMNDFQNFINDYLSLKNEMDFFPVGFEIDYFKGCENDTKQLMFNMSHVLYSRGIKVNHFSLSIHSLHGMSLYKKDAILLILKKYGPKQLLLDYFENMKFAINHFDFDFLCHPGVIAMSFLHYGNFDIFLDKDLWKIYLDEYKGLIDLVVTKNLCLEINTSGFNKGCPGPEPNPYMPFEIFEYALDKKVKFVVGSDFHHPEDSFRYFDQIYKILKDNNADVYKIVNKKQVRVELNNLKF